MKKEKKGFARLMELAGKKRKKLTLACILAVISSGARIGFYFTIYGVIVELIRHYDLISEINVSYLKKLSWITLLFAFVYGGCAYLSSASAHQAAFDVIYELKIKLMEKLAKIPSGYFSKTTQGAIRKVMSDDTERIEIFIAHNLCDIAAAVATPLFTLIYLFYMDYRFSLAVIFPILISVLLLGICLARPDKAALQAEMHDAQEKMNGTIVEYIHGMAVIKVFNRTLSAFKRYEADLNHFVGAVEKTAHANALPMGGYYAFFGAQMLFMLPAFIWLIPREAHYQEILPVALLFLFVGGGLKEPMENMMQMVILSGSIMEGVDRIDRILRQTELKADGTEIPQSYDVEFDHVFFSYEEGIQAVKDVSFHLPQGSITGLVGPSGGGKSTLAQLLLRFYETEQGAIRIGGVDIRQIPGEQLTKLVSYVFQDSFLFHDTISNNIRMGDFAATEKQVIEAAKNAQIHDVIMALPKGYETVIGEKEAYLSGGEKQRIAIARVFLRNTPIVILDEATAYADAENEAKIQEAFAKLSQNKTVLIIAHRLKTVEKADQILVMEKGERIGFAAHEQLLRECPKYQTMIEANERREIWRIGKGAANV